MDVTKALHVFGGWRITLCITTKRAGVKTYFGLLFYWQETFGGCACKQIQFHCRFVNLDN